MMARTGQIGHSSGITGTGAQAGRFGTLAMTGIGAERKRRYFFRPRAGLRAGTFAFVAFLPIFLEAGFFFAGAAGGGFFV